MIGSFMNLSRRSTSEKRRPGRTAPADIPAAREKEGAMKAKPHPAPSTNPTTTPELRPPTPLAAPWEAARKLRRRQSQILKINFTTTNPLKTSVRGPLRPYA